MEKKHKDAMSYIKQILEAISHKIAAVWPPATHLEDNPGTLEEQGRTHMWGSPMDAFTQTRKSRKTR